MANAEMIERLQFEIGSVEAELNLSKAAILHAAEQLQHRAQRAIEQSKCLVDDLVSTVSWIDFAQSDIEEARRAEHRLVTLQEKHKLLVRWLDIAEEQAKSTNGAPADQVF